MQIGRGRYLRMCDHCSFRTYLRSDMAVSIYNNFSSYKMGKHMYQFQERKSQVIW